MDPKIVIWNIRGLNDLNRREAVKKKTRDWKPSIVMLQETKIQQYNDLMVLQCWSNRAVKLLDFPSQGSSGGILCLWDSSKIHVLDSLIGPFSVTLLCKNVTNGFEWMLTGVYAPCSSYTEEVNLFWREIEEVRCFWNYPWVIGGDFNEIRFSHDRSSGGDVTDGMERFNRFISRHYLIDLLLLRATYTWTNNQFQSIRSRIDRFLVTADWEIFYPQVIQQAFVRPCSDHNPIALTCQGMQHGPSPFRCEYYWFSHPNFLNFVKEMWLSFSVSGSAGFIFYKKLQLLKAKLREWSTTEYGEIDRRLEELEDIFVTLGAAENDNNGMNETQWEERVKARQEYCKLTLINVEKLRSIARVTHTKDFEHNTKYFHRPINERRRRSFIGSIKVNGLTNDDQEIKSGIVSYFKDIFQNQSARSVSMEGMNFPPIGEEMKLWLKRDFDEDECIAAIKMLGQFKAPGPDGSQSSFILFVGNL
ncbi:uncharacterized protein LOC113295270 [Papaver somniferum]|uniref:uncharacterized protein LOC113295270 n=1 Tax=Papaver somniferum TaxID=3469 RepID=UPI000E6F5655|nr:uncharacterized protein LOC113295270 [Papaver somniferum]